MNKKGFTLVELIATIALLAVIAIISFVSINSVLNESKKKNCISLVDNITSASKEYVSDNRYNFTNNSDISISAETLITSNYLSSSLDDPFSNKELDPAKIDVSIELNNDYSAKNIEIKINGVLVDCGNKKTFEYASLVASGVIDENDGNTSNDETDNSINETDDNTSNDTSSGSSDGVNNSVVGEITSVKIVKYVNKFPDGAVCAQAIDEFYTENGITYYFTCKMSQYIYVIVNGVEYRLVEALESGVVTIAEVEEAKGSKFLSKSVVTSDR